ncbi:uncharacterized protein A1O9_01694 [Exophiala aquamarina CBS 119918]|uniref:Xylanolytic transcriptional activator regulatory domain-containing protein n=1 Tax=Exophiala aquamarina CBS 119918 TaxID=1182545 RepID=A0A072PV45_9EURO|nr:uncharacterized protein A1O9_01694 [Exophiala aquamarina CBS 119918]KEF63716.1 hypothetical protein A1O9_01694 [Exophiala aquamarina CBS 119918]
MVLEGISRLVDSLPRKTSRAPPEDTQATDSEWPFVGDEDSSTTHPIKRRRTHAVEEAFPRTSQNYRPPTSSEPPQSPSVAETEGEASNSPEHCGDGLDPRDDELGTIDLQRYLSPSQQHHQPGRSEGDKRRALEAAVQVAKKTAIMQPKPEFLMSSLMERVNFYDSSTYPTAEFVHTIMDRRRNNVAMTYYLDINTNVSPSTFEDMALALINHKVYGQTRLHYIVCVNYIAYSYLVAIGSEGQSRAMVENLEESKRRYYAKAFAALDEMDLKAAPDIPMLQALLSGAMLSQDTGNMRRCWRLNTNACRICASLGGRALSELNTSGSFEEAMNTRLVFLKCYIFDKSLSANMYQPSCSAHMRLDSSKLDLSQPSHAMLFILLELSRVQEIIVRETSAIKSPSQPARLGMENLTSNEELRACQGRMHRIFAKTQEFRAKPPSNQDGYLKFEWMNVDFIYASMMTTLIRLTARIDDTRSNHECLRHARNSLSSLNVLLQIVSQPSSFRGMALSSLAWLVPLYPLRPLYCVFGNIVATSDSLDLKLLRDTANGLESLAQTHASMGAIHKLCSSLIDLCAPFVETSESGQNPQTSQLGPVGLSTGRLQQREAVREQGHPRNVPLNPDGRAIAGPGNTNLGFNSNLPQAQVNFNKNDGSQNTYNFDGDLDWELFCAQPSLDFLDMDLEN